MARAEQYRNLYPFLGAGDRGGIKPSETSQLPFHLPGFGHLNPDLGFWPSNLKALVGRGLQA